MNYKRIWEYGYFKNVPDLKECMNSMDSKVASLVIQSYKARKQNQLEEKLKDYVSSEWDSEGYQ